MKIEKKLVLFMLSQTMKVTKTIFLDLMERDMDVFTATSYENEEYRCWMFHIHGSPTKSIGFIKSDGLGIKLCYSYLSNNAKTYYFTKAFVRTTYRNLQFGLEPKECNAWLYASNLNNPMKGVTNGSGKENV